MRIVGRHIRSLYPPLLTIDLLYIIPFLISSSVIDMKFYSDSKVASSSSSSVIKHFDASLCSLDVASTEKLALCSSVGSRVGLCSPVSSPVGNRVGLCSPVCSRVGLCSPVGSRVGLCSPVGSRVGLSYTVGSPEVFRKQTRHFYS